MAGTFGHTTQHDVRAGVGGIQGPEAGNFVERMIKRGQGGTTAQLEPMRPAWKDEEVEVPRGEYLTKRHLAHWQQRQPFSLQQQLPEAATTWGEIPEKIGLVQTLRALDLGHNLLKNLPTSFVQIETTRSVGSFFELFSIAFGILKMRIGKVKKELLSKKSYCRSVTHLSR